jgi:2-(1,2-epoxy-1,2-dihydrophenyl)acetyl-CoA isomerase
LIFGVARSEPMGRVVFGSLSKNELLLLESMYESVLLTTDGAVAILKLNRPEKLNALGGPMRDEILDVLNTISGQQNVRVLVLTGAGRGFCAGGDIHHLKQLRESKDVPGFCELLSKGQEITRCLRSLPKPVIAAINGPCAGAGFSLALSCDIRIASEAATFGPSFARIGLHPDWGGSWFLPKLVGSAKACELIFTAAMISAGEAEKMGLINRLVPHDELMPSVLQLADTMAKNPPGVLRLAKESIYRSLSADLQTAFARETEVQMECFWSEDFLEGLTAFLEKRKPQFRGR